MRTRNAKLQSGENNSSLATIVSSSLFIIGICIVLFALVYMIVDLNKADSIITIWIIFMAVGVLLLFFGLIFRLLTRSSKRKTRNFSRRTAI
ncbi:MAG: hypothetical protein FWD60_07325 [Candidatus Azobacteroides sp.]|nr:hypothetical protein [Candidatus Azobacteroides sp.]